MGTPEFAVETLKALVENHYNVVAVVTQPDKPVGRHQNELQPSPSMSMPPCCLSIVARPPSTGLLSMVRQRRV